MKVSENNNDLKKVWNAGIVASLRTLAAKLALDLVEIPLDERNLVHELLHKWELALRKDWEGS